jgi:hypothetical protein
MASGGASSSGSTHNARTCSRATTTSSSSNATSRRNQTRPDTARRARGTADTGDSPARANDATSDRPGSPAPGQQASTAAERPRQPNGCSTHAPRRGTRSRSPHHRDRDPNARPARSSSRNARMAPLRAPPGSPTASATADAAIRTSPPSPAHASPTWPAPDAPGSQSDANQPAERTSDHTRTRTTAHSSRPKNARGENRRTPGSGGSKAPAKTAPLWRVGIEWPSLFSIPTLLARIRKRQRWVWRRALSTVIA